MGKDKIGFWLLLIGSGGMGITIGWGLYDLLISGFPVPLKILFISILLIITGVIIFGCDANDVD